MGFIFTTRSEVLFLINFIVVNLEAGNETPEQLCSGWVLHKIKKWSEKWVVFILFKPL